MILAFDFKSAWIGANLRPGLAFGKTALVLLLLAASTTPLAWAEDTMTPTGLTLDGAEKEAFDHSPAYRKAQDAESEAGWGQTEALSKGFLPHLRIEGQHFFNNELFGSTNSNYTLLTIQFQGAPQPISFPGIYPNTTLNLEASYDLFDGLKNIHELDAANNRHEAAKVESDFARLQLTEIVRLKYYTALGAKILSDMADQNVKTLQDHLKIVQDQLDNGQATKYDVLRVEVQLSVAKSDQISAHDNEALAREDLGKVMGLPEDQRTLAGPLPVLDSDVLLKAAADASYQDSPRLRAQELQSLAAGDESAAAQSFWFPRISLFGQYQWYNSPAYISGGFDYNDYTSFQTDYFVGINATWDILDGGSSLARANESSEKAKQAGEDYQASKLQTPYDFDLWKRKLVSSVALYKARLADVDEAKESARLATVGFQAGTRTTTDVLDAELQEYQASAGVVQAQLNALEALINLELVTGKRLTHD